MSEPLLTEDEHRAMDLTAGLTNLLARIIRAGGSDSQHGDLNEAAVRVHGLQNMILAQAAARAYPDRYRLLGEGPRWTSAE